MQSITAPRPGTVHGLSSFRSDRSQISIVNGAPAASSLPSADSASLSIESRPGTTP